MLEAILAVVYIITVSVAARIYWKIRKETEPVLEEHPVEWFRYKKETEGNILYILTFPISAPVILMISLGWIVVSWMFHVIVVIPSDKLYPKVKELILKGEKYG